MDKKALPSKTTNILYRRHRRGAYVRGGASMALWVFALIAYTIQLVDFYSYAGISVSVIYLVLMNPPTLWVLKHLKREKIQRYWSLAINALEILGYTAIIYFAGGLSRSYLTLLYPALVSYVGVMAPRRFSYLITGFCALSLTGMVLLEYFQVIPHTQNYLNTYLSLSRQLFEVGVITGFLSLIAFVTSSNSQVIRKGKELLKDQNEILKKSQQQIEQAQQILKEKNVALRGAMEKAQAGDRMKSDFLANMSHEFRTPLNHIIGFSELLSDKHFGELNPTQEDYLNDILHSSRHLLSLVNDLLDLSKIENGKMELSYSEIHFPELLEKCLVMVKGKALNHRIELASQFHQIPDAIRADERKLKQILYNLLSNAVKFTPDGGSVRISARRAGTSEFRGWSEKEINTQVPIQQYEGDADFIQISIEDTGIGLLKDDLERIFQPFEQAYNSASRRYQGTGLGLALTRKMVELHGGRIWAESTGEGQGSAFHFILPKG